MFANVLAGKEIQKAGNLFAVDNEVFKVGHQQHSRETKFMQLCENTVDSELMTVVDTAAFADQASTLLDVVNLL